MYNFPKQLTRDHIKLLEEMKLLAVNVIETTGHPVDEFNIGFHAAPSMDRLHMHVISKDFHSPCLKTKQHWNTFNTKYFLSTECKSESVIFSTKPVKSLNIFHLSVLIDQLRNTGKIEKFNEQYIKGLLATELACHVCKSKVKNMPTLKEHILTHVNESRKFE